jgi:hypothetical protein
MVDGGDEVLGYAEAEGTMADRLDLIVHAFDGPIGNPDLGHILQF